MAALEVLALDEATPQVRAPAAGDGYVANRPVTLAGGTVTTSNPVLSATQTWNAGAVAFDLLHADVTNTASAAASTMLNLKLGGTSLLQFKPTGGGVLAGAPSLKVGTGDAGQAGWLLGAYGSGVSALWTTGMPAASTNYALLAVPASTYLNAATGVYIDIGDVDKAYISATDVRYQAATIVGWTAGAPDTALDTGYSRESAGLVQINNGTANAYANLKLKTFIATGGISAATVKKTAAYTTTADDYTILVDAAGGAITITLIAATGSGRIYNIKKIDSAANDVTIDGAGAETIDGAATKVLSAQWASVQIQDTEAGKWSIL